MKSLIQIVNNYQIYYCIFVSNLRTHLSFLFLHLVKNKQTEEKTQTIDLSYKTIVASKKYTQKKRWNLKHIYITKIAIRTEKKIEKKTNTNTQKKKKTRKKEKRRDEKKQHKQFM